MCSYCTCLLFWYRLKTIYPGFVTTMCIFYIYFSWFDLIDELLEVNFFLFFLSAGLEALTILKSLIVYCANNVFYFHFLLPGLSFWCTFVVIFSMQACVSFLGIENKARHSMQMSWTKWYVLAVTTKKFLLRRIRKLGVLYLKYGLWAL